MVDEDGRITEIRIWKVPRSKTKPEGIKYSMVYIIDDERIVGYDNAEGKSHHRHFKGRETGYSFTSIDRLFDDFRKDIERVKK